MDSKTLKSVLKIILISILVIFSFWNYQIVFNLVSTIVKVFTPIIIGFALAFILKGPHKTFNNFFKNCFKKSKTGKLPKVLSLISVYLSLFLVFFGLFFIIIPEFAKSFEMLRSNLEFYIANAEKFFNDIYNKIHIDFLQDINFKEMIDKFISTVSNSLPSVVSGALGFTTSIISTVTSIFLGLVISVYILADKDKLTAQCKKVVLAVFKKDKAEKLLFLGTEANSVFSKFIKGQLTEATILGVLCYIGMTIFRFNYPLLVSVLIGVTSLIPIFGAFIGTIPSALILLIVEPIQAIWFVIFIIVLQQIEGNLIYPKVVGTSLGLPGLLVITAIIIWGGLLGFFGMLLGVPLTSLIYELSRLWVNKRLAEKQEKKATKLPPTQNI